MERLTFKSNSGYALLKGTDCSYGNHSFDCQLKEGIEKLGLALNKLADYEDLEKQGLLLKLPCKVGDYIWDNDFGKPCGYKVTGFSFGNLNQDDWEDENVFDQVIVYYTNSSRSITGNFAVSEIGKTVFLTKDAAEDALKRME